LRRILTTIAVATLFAAASPATFAIDARDLPPAVRAKLNTVSTMTEPKAPVIRIPREQLQSDICKRAADKVLFHGYVRSWAKSKEAPQGRPITHWPVTLTDQSGNTIARGDTDSQGYYCLLGDGKDLREGLYSLQVNDATLPEHALVPVSLLRPNMKDPPEDMVPLNEAAGIDVTPPRSAAAKRIDLVMNTYLYQDYSERIQYRDVPPNSAVLALVTITAITLIRRYFYWQRRRINLRKIS
jgi:hypothetical protein